MRFDALLQAVLWPVVRYLVRRGVVFQEFDAAARAFFVRAARDELGKTTKKINASRLSVITGLQRREVVRYLDTAAIVPDHSASLIARVLAVWERDPAFLTKEGTPKVLRHEGEDSEFIALCARVSTAVNAGTLLFELKRRSLVVESSRGLKLLAVEEGTRTDIARTDILLGKDIDLLLRAVDENVRQANKTPNHHTRTVYDNVYVDRIEEIREWILNEGRDFHRRIRAYLSQYDHDISPAPVGAERAGGVVAITSASIVIDSSLEGFERR